MQSVHFAHAQLKSKAHRRGVTESTKAQKPGAARPSKKQADSSRKNVGVTAAALPTVLRKQHPKRRGVSKAVRGSSSDVRKRDAEVLEMEFGLNSSVAESPEEVTNTQLKLSS